MIRVHKMASGIEGIVPTHMAACLWPAVTVPLRTTAASGGLCVPLPAA